MSLQTKKYVYTLLPLMVALAVVIYFAVTQQWLPFLLSVGSGLAGIGLAEIRLRYNLFWE